MSKKQVKLVSCSGKTTLSFESERSEDWSKVKDAEEICEVLIRVVPAAVFEEVARFVDAYRDQDIPNSRFLREYFDKREADVQIEEMIEEMIEKNESD